MARIDRTSGGAAPALGAVVREKGLWLFEALGPFALIGAAVIAWEVTALQKAIDPFLLPAFSTVVMRIFDDLITGKLLLNAALTLYRALVAFGLAASIGVLLGILMARVVSVGWFFDPIVSIGLPAPKIALLPVFMLWFGLFDLAKIMMVAFSASFQIIATTWAATRSVEREIIWSARSLGATDRQILWQVILPAALPQILTGLQIAMPISLIVVLVTEMVMGGEGLGLGHAAQRPASPTRRVSSPASSRSACSASR